jgi:hypothetical protein
VDGMSSVQDDLVKSIQRSGTTFTAVEIAGSNGKMRTVYEIIPDPQGSTWNRYAARFANGYHGTKLAIDPSLEGSGAHGMFDPRTNTFFVSTSGFRQGTRHTAFAHELWHAYFHKLRRKGTDSLFHTLIYQPDRPISPFHRHGAENYRNLQSVEETFNVTANLETLLTYVKREPLGTKENWKKIKQDFLTLSKLGKELSLQTAHRMRRARLGNLDSFSPIILKESPVGEKGLWLQVDDIYMPILHRDLKRELEGVEVASSLDPTMKAKLWQFYSRRTQKTGTLGIELARNYEAFGQVVDQLPADLSEESLREAVARLGEGIQALRVSARSLGTP